MRYIGEIYLVTYVQEHMIIRELVISKEAYEKFIEKEKDKIKIVRVDLPHERTILTIKEVENN